MAYFFGPSCRSVAPNLCRRHFYVGPSNTVLLAVVMHFLYHSTTTLLRRCCCHS